jgi:2-keto-3-deoxy-L-arabinonate dehydratase
MNPHEAGTALGVVPVIPMPFTDSEDVDWGALEPLIRFAIESGAGAACLPAYGSEFYKLSEQERFDVVESAVRFAAGRIPIMAQSNHGSARLACEIAKRNAGVGADLISFALPRQFAYSEEALLRYAETICKGVSAPVLVQDFNPGGPSVGPAFAKRLKQAAPNFMFLKLEEPGMGPKIQAIREATQDSIGVLEGWGGMYLPELFQTGLAGVMPGLALCDLFVRLWNLLQSGDNDAALSLHTLMLPQISLALQNMELFHHVEKRLLKARGLIQNAVVREPAIILDDSATAHIERVNRLALEQVARYASTSPR